MAISSTFAALVVATASIVGAQPEELADLKIKTLSPKDFVQDYCANPDKCNTEVKVFIPPNDSTIIVNEDLNLESSPLDQSRIVFEAARWYFSHLKHIDAMSPCSEWEKNTQKAREVQERFVLIRADQLGIINLAKGESIDMTPLSHHPYPTWCIEDKNQLHQSSN